MTKEEIVREASRDFDEEPRYLINEPYGMDEEPDYWEWMDNLEG